MDDVCDVEAQAVADGFEQGTRHGRETGRRDAQSLGVQKGLEIGSELGYMLGCIQALQTHAERNPDSVDPKPLLLAENLKQLIESLPLNPEDPQLQDQIGHLRSRFKVLTAGVKVLQDIEAKDVKTLEF